MSLVLRINGLHFYLSSSSTTRAGQRFPSQQQQESNVRQGDPWSEIDRRNQRVLHPLNARDSYGAQNQLPTFNQQRNKFSSHSFNFESYSNYCRRRRSSPQNDEHTFNESSLNFQKLLDKQSLLISSNNDSAFVYGNSVIKSNKIAILNIFDQQSRNGDNTNIYVNKHGVIIGEDGPFWPRDFRILYPTPKLLSRELAPKEFYLTVTISSLLSK
jgi:hypothetical protein